VLNFLFTSRNVGVRSNPPRNSRIGIVSPGFNDSGYISAKRGTGETRTSHGSTIHDFELCDGLALVVLVWWRTRRLAADNGQFHVLDLDAHEQKVDLPHNHILEMISV